jgi:hypothetical protein
VARNVGPEAAPTSGPGDLLPLVRSGGKELG